MRFALPANFACTFCITFARTGPRYVVPVQWELWHRTAALHPRPILRSFSSRIGLALKAVFILYKYTVLARLLQLGDEPEVTQRLYRPTSWFSDLASPFPKYREEDADRSGESTFALDVEVGRFCTTSAEPGKHAY